MHKFENRYEAGVLLGEALLSYRGDKNVMILGLPRGGVVLAHAVAKALHLPFDVWIVRKLGVPGHEELAMGAIATGDLQNINRNLARGLNISERSINQVIARERNELARRNRLYRNGAPPPRLSGKTVIIVDDGMATGETMKMAVDSVRRENPARIIAAVPVSSQEAYMAIQTITDEIVCLIRPEPFIAVGNWFRDFPQLKDSHVLELIEDQNWLVKPFSEETATG